MCGGALADRCSRGFQIAQRTSDPHQVLAELELGLEVDERSPRHRADLHYNLSAVYQSAGEWHKAIASAKLAEKLYAEAGMTVSLAAVFDRARLAGALPSTDEAGTRAGATTAPEKRHAAASITPADFAVVGGAPAGTPTETRKPVTCTGPMHIVDQNIRVANAFEIFRVEPGCELIIERSTLTLHLDEGVALSGDGAKTTRTAANAIRVLGGSLTIRDSVIAVEGAVQHTDGFRHDALFLFGDPQALVPAKIEVRSSTLRGEVRLNHAAANVAFDDVVVLGATACRRAASLKLERVRARTKRDGEDAVVHVAACPLEMSGSKVANDGQGPALELWSTAEGAITSSVFGAAAGVGVLVGFDSGTVALTDVVVRAAKTPLYLKKGTITVTGGHFEAEGDTRVALEVGLGTTVRLSNANLVGGVVVRQRADVTLEGVTISEADVGLNAEQNARVVAKQCEIDATTWGATANTDASITLVGGSVHGGKARLHIHPTGTIDVQGTKLSGGKTWRGPR